MAAVVLTLNQLSALSGDAAVLHIDVDRTRAAETVPTDTSFGDQWSLRTIGWDQVYGSVTPAGSAVVAVLDTGVEASHPDLVGKLVAGASFVDGSAWDSDSNGHGTAMAGIVAASTNNGLGVAGVGYAGVRVMPVTVLGADGLGQDSDIIEGLVWAADHGADVALMSFSATGYSLRPAGRGRLRLVARRRRRRRHRQRRLVRPGLPGRRSRRHRRLVDRPVRLTLVVIELRRRRLPGRPGRGHRHDVPRRRLRVVSGTSASAAEVAGAAALLRAVDPSASAGVIVNRLAGSADPAGDRRETGNGRLNLARAVGDTSTAASLSRPAPRRWEVAARSSGRMSRLRPPPICPAW